MSQQQEEEARKIQFSGKSSYMLALPKKWVKQQGLKPSDQVIVVKQSDGSLLISPKGITSSGSKGEVTMEVSQKESRGSLVRKLISLYLLAYTMIHVKPKEGKLTSTQRDTVKETVRKNLIGTEIIADSTDGITVQVLLSFPELSIENALRRMFLITSSMHRDAINALRDLDMDAAQGVIKSDDEVDRFNIYVVRQLKIAVQNDRILKEMGLSAPKDCLGYRLIVKSVERVADHASKISQGIITLRQPLADSTTEKVTEMSEFALNLFEESGRALFKRDYDAAENVIEKARSISELQEKLLTDMEDKRMVSSYHTVRLIMEDIRRTAEYASDIAEIVLNMTAEQVLVKLGN